MDPTITKAAASIPTIAGIMQALCLTRQEHPRQGFAPLRGVHDLLSQWPISASTLIMARTAVDIARPGPSESGLPGSDSGWLLPASGGIAL